jgi:hypothetical protein
MTPDNYVEEPSAWDTLDDLCRVDECGFDDLPGLLNDDFYAEKAESGARYFEVLKERGAGVCVPVETAVGTAADVVEGEAYTLLSDRVLPLNTLRSSVQTVLSQPGMESVALLPVLLNGRVIGFQLFFRDYAASDLLTMYAGTREGHFNGGKGWYKVAPEIIVMQDGVEGGITGLLPN